MKSGLIFTLLLNISFVVFGVNDSIKNVPVQLFEITPFRSDSLLVSFMDTNLLNFYSFVDDGYNNTNTLGNYGLGISSFLFEGGKYGFYLDSKPFSKKNLRKISVYRAKQPFTRVSYITGPKKLQVFNVLFSTSINESLNFTVDYGTFGSDGTYINQSTRGNSIGVQSSFINTNKRYNYFVKFNVNSGVANENGGIKSDSIYSELIKLSPLDAENNKLKVQVWQEGATNHYDYRNFRLVNFFSFAKKKDGILDDSGFSIVLDNSGYYEDVWYDDKDADSLYLDVFNINVADSSDIYDKTHVYGFENTGTLKYLDKKTGILLYSGLDVNFYEYQNILRSIDLNQVGLNSGFDGLKLLGILINVRFKKGLVGYNNDGYKGNVGLGYFISNTGMRVSYQGMLQSSLPMYKTISYASSIQDWENDFSYVNRMEHVFNLVHDSINFNLGARVYSINNFVYYSGLSVPVQHDETIYGFEFKAGKVFKFGSFFVDLNAIYQGVNSSAPINLATFVWKAAAYHQRSIFDGAMELKYGMEYWQNTSYTANYYAPFSRSFILQNEYNVGNYPYMDLFFSARIKTAQGFVKFQNVGQFIFRDNYMMIPLYPLQDFGFSFGLRWDFYN